MKTKLQHLKENWVLVMIWNIFDSIPLYILARRIFSEDMFLIILTVFMGYFLICVFTLNKWYTEYKIDELEKQLKELKDAKK